MKVSTIEEAQGISNVKVNEFIRSLQTFELAVYDRPEKKNKNITFISNTNEEDVQCEKHTDESISDAIVLVDWKFNKVLKRMDNKEREKKRKQIGFIFCKMTIKHIKIKMVRGLRKVYYASLMKYSFYILLVDIINYFLV